MLATVSAFCLSGTCALVVAECCSQRCEPVILKYMRGSSDNNDAALHDMPTPHGTCWHSFKCRAQEADLEETAFFGQLMNGS